MRRRINNLLKGQKGIGLLEVLLAVAILGVIGVGFMQALATTSEGADLHEKRVTASSLAQSQVEYIKASPYLPVSEGDYSVAVSSHGYSIDIETVNIDKDGLEVEVETGKQEVTVKVYHGEDFVLSMTTLKVDW